MNTFERKTVTERGKKGTIYVRIGRWLVCLLVCLAVWLAGWRLKTDQARVIRERDDPCKEQTGLGRRNKSEGLFRCSGIKGIGSQCLADVGKIGSRHGLEVT